MNIRVLEAACGDARRILQDQAGGGHAWCQAEPFCNMVSVHVTASVLGGLFVLTARYATEALQHERGMRMVFDWLGDRVEDAVLVQQFRP